MSSTPTKAKDKERIIKLLHESILHLCKVSVSGPGNIEVDGIVCITQPNESDIVVKVHETFSNDRDGGPRTPGTGEKRKHSFDNEGGNKTPRREGERQRTPVSRRLINDGPMLDLTRDDSDGVRRLHRSPHRNKTSAVIDLTSAQTAIPQQLNITQVRSLQQQQRMTGRGMQRFVSVRGRAGYQMVPRQRFMGQGNMMAMRQQMGVRPVGSPIPHRGFRPQGRMMLAARGQGPPGSIPMPPNIQGQPGAPTGMPFDAQIHSYKGLRCRYRDCNFACSNKYYLETHVLQHFDADPFSCNEEGCDFKSKNKQNLYQHYKVTHSAVNPQFCFKCIRAFKSPEELNIHTQLCTVESMKCDHCGDTFLGKMAMAKHLSDVYLAESTRDVKPPDQGVAPDQQQQQHTGSDHSHTSASQSPATTPSPGHTSLQSPVAASPHKVEAVSPSVSQPPANIPDMSAPLNIIPDLQANNQQTSSDEGQQTQQPELTQLEQLARSTSPQPQTTEVVAFEVPQIMPSEYPRTNQEFENQTPGDNKYVEPGGTDRLSETSNNSMPPHLHPTLPFEQQQTYPNILNQEDDTIQTPSLADAMSLPDAPIDSKPPDFDVMNT